MKNFRKIFLTASIAAILFNLVFGLYFIDVRLLVMAGYNVLLAILILFLNKKPNKMATLF